MKTIKNNFFLSILLFFSLQGKAQVHSKISGSSRIAETAITPNAKTVYGNSMTLAYGVNSNTGHILNTAYGIQSTTRTGLGCYDIVLNNVWTGQAKVNAKGFITAGTGTVKFDLTIDSPLGGTVTTTFKLTSSGVSHIISTYVGANGAPYDAYA